MENINISHEDSTWTPLKIKHQYDSRVKFDYVNIKSTDGISLISSTPQQRISHNVVTKFSNLALTNMTRLDTLIKFDVDVSQYPEQFTTSLLVGGYPYDNVSSAYIKIVEQIYDAPQRDWVVGQKLTTRLDSDGDLVRGPDGEVEKTVTESWRYSQDIRDSAIYYLVTLHDAKTCSIEHDDNFSTVFLTVTGNPQQGTIDYKFIKSDFNVPTEDQKFGYLINRENGYLILYKEFNNEIYYLTSDTSTNSMTALPVSGVGADYIDYPADGVIRTVPYKKQTKDLKLTNNWVSYKTTGDENNLEVNLTRSYTNVYNNYLIDAQLTEIDRDQMKVNFMQLKNQISPHGNMSRGNPFPNLRDVDHREYHKIFKSKIRDEDPELFLGYDSYETEIVANPGEVTYFNAPQNMYPYKKININDAGLVEAGAIGGDTPLVSDKIFKKAADYKYNTPYGAPLDEETGIWLCKWLKSNIGVIWDRHTLYRKNVLVEHDWVVYKAIVATRGDRPDINARIWDKTDFPPYVWVDRYYNPEYFTALEALSLSGQYYTYEDKFTYIIDSLEAQNEYVFDKQSDITFEPGCLYAYHRAGGIDDTTTLETVSDTLVHQGLEPTYNIDRSPYINIDNDLAFTGQQYIEASSSTNTKKSDFTISFDLASNDWSKPLGSVIVGNYINDGVAFFNKQNITPYIIIPDENGVGIYNTDLKQLNHIEMDDVVSVVKHAANEDMTIVTRTGMAYMYDMKGMLVEQVDMTDFETLYGVAVNQQYPKKYDIASAGITMGDRFIVDVEDYIHRYDIRDESINQRNIIFPDHVIGQVNQNENNNTIEPDPAKDDFPDMPQSEQTFIRPSRGYQFRINCDQYTIDNHSNVWYIKGPDVYKYTLSDRGGVQAVWNGFINDNPVYLRAENRYFGSIGNFIGFYKNGEVQPDGLKTLFTLVNEWNDIHPENQVEIVNGNPDLVPGPDEVIQLAGGVDQGEPITYNSFKLDKTYSKFNSIKCDYNDNIFLLHDEKVITKTDDLRNTIATYSISGYAPELQDQIFDQCYMDLCTEFNENGYDNYVLVLLKPRSNATQTYLLKLNDDLTYRSLNILNTPQLSGVDFTKLDNITNYETNKDLYRRTINGNYMTFQMRYQNYFDTDKTEMVQLFFDLQDLSPGYHHFAVSFDSKSSSIGLFVDGKLRDTATSDDRYAGAAYAFSKTIQAPVLAGTAPFFNNITLSEHLQKSGNYFVDNCRINNLSIYNECLNFFKIKVLSRKNKTIQPITITLPSGRRNFIDHATKFFKHQPPGARTADFNINITAPTLTASELQQEITEQLREEVQELLPVNSHINKINWLS